MNCLRLCKLKILNSLPRDSITYSYIYVGIKEMHRRWYKHVLWSRTIRRKVKKTRIVMVGHKKRATQVRTGKRR